jgi:hypothetical protein
LITGNKVNRSCFGVGVLICDQGRGSPSVTIRPRAFFISPAQFFPPKIFEMTDKSRQSETENTATNTPYARIASFFQDYDLVECHALIWQLLTAALSSEDSDFWNKQQRGNVVFFCRDMDALIRAASEINHQRSSV